MSHRAKACGYANVTVADKDVLLVASGTYDYDSDGKKFVAIDAYVDYQLQASFGSGRETIRDRSKT